MGYRHLVDLNDFSKAEIEGIIEIASDIYDNPKAYAKKCEGKILATLFYEPSTRTQMSFQSAMLRLGGQIIGFDNPQNSSVSKGENLVDTIKVVSGYADIMVIRHPVEGSALAGALYSDCPLINAGDGGHFHPTQTLTDLLTLKRELGDINNITIGLCGDLKNGRTVHSLIKALCLYNNINFVLISTDFLLLPDYFKELIIQHNCTYTETTSLDIALPELDVLYMTRIQKERFESEELYQKEKDVYILTAEKLKNAKKSLKILHPLPRIDEISMDVDKDSRALYFKQTKYGVYARMALMYALMFSDEDKPILKGKPYKDLLLKCKNPKCVTNSEHYLEQYFHIHNDKYFCEYCDYECN